MNPQKQALKTGAYKKPSQPAARATSHRSGGGGTLPYSNLKRWQKFHGLKPTGKADPRTRRKLRQHRTKLVRYAPGQEPWRWKNTRGRFNA